MTAIIDIRPHPEDDGSHVLQLVTDGGKHVDVTVNAADIQRILATLQVAHIKRVFAASQHLDQPMTESLSLVELSLTDSAVANRGQTSYLSMTCREVGTFVVGADGETFRHLRGKIDRLLKDRAVTRKIN